MLDLLNVRSPSSLSLSFKVELVLGLVKPEVVGLDFKDDWASSKKFSSQLRHCIIILRAAVFLLEFFISAKMVTISLIFS